MESSVRRRTYNRIQAVMAHTNRYAFMGQARLAADAGMSRSAVSRFLSGQSNPSFTLVIALLKALEKQLDRKIDPRELVSFDGSYPTASVCELVGCRGCLPSEVYTDEDTIKPEYQSLKSGQWSLEQGEQAHEKVIINTVVAREEGL